MVRLAAEDRPDVLCLQELPAWADPHLERWSGMRAFVDIAQLPRLGPLPIPAAVGGAITSLHHGLFRSAVAGQANAILVRPDAEVVSRDRLVLNGRHFRDAQAAWLGLPLVTRLAWAKERRLVQVVRTRLPDDRTFAVGNLHATSYPADQRLADAELLRAAVFVDALSRPGDIVVLAGDFNIAVARSGTLAQLTNEEWGFSAAAATGIDHVLVRGARVQPLERWPRARRVIGGRTLSDHTPVDARVE
jgi:hypothetical protein